MTLCVRSKFRFFSLYFLVCGSVTVALCDFFLFISSKWRLMHFNSSFSLLVLKIATKNAQKSQKTIFQMFWTIFARNLLFRPKIGFSFWLPPLQKICFPQNDIKINYQHFLEVKCQATIIMRLPMGQIFTPRPPKITEDLVLILRNFCENFLFLANFKFFLLIPLCRKKFPKKITC